MYLALGHIIVLIGMAPLMNQCIEGLLITAEFVGCHITGINSHILSFWVKKAETTIFHHLKFDFTRVAVLDFCDFIFYTL